MYKWSFFCGVSKREGRLSVVPPEGRPRFAIPRGREALLDPSGIGVKLDRKTKPKRAHPIFFAKESGAARYSRLPPKMSESVVTSSSAPRTPKVSTVPEAVIRIAGNSQDGIQAIGGFLARLAGTQRAGSHDLHDDPFDDFRRAFDFPGAHRLGRSAQRGR